MSDKPTHDCCPACKDVIHYLRAGYSHCWQAWGFQHDEGCREQRKLFRIEFCPFCGEKLPEPKPERNLVVRLKLPSKLETSPREPFHSWTPGKTYLLKCKLGDLKLNCGSHLLFRINGVLFISGVITATLEPYEGDDARISCEANTTPLPHHAPIDAQLIDILP